jgi:hypothetical protein
MPVFYEDSLGERIARGLTEGSSADDELMEDRAAFEAAQAAVNGRSAAVQPTLDWVAVAGPIVFSMGTEFPGVIAAQITMPLDAAEIEYAWDPYPPAEMPLALEPTGVLASRKFTLLVPPKDANVAVALLDDARPESLRQSENLRPTVNPGAQASEPQPYAHPGTAATPVPVAPAVERPGHPFVRMALIGVAFSAIVAAVYYGYGALQ